MKPLSERDENSGFLDLTGVNRKAVGMKPLSERDENGVQANTYLDNLGIRRNEATL